MPSHQGLRFRGFHVPESELEWSFDPSGGPGGQHANRTSTRSTVSFDLAASRAFPAATRDDLLRRLGTRASSGVVTVSADDTRSQWRNRAIARQRLVELLEQALTPIRARRATSPSRSARRRRLEDKRRRGERKRLRRRPDVDE